MTPLILAAILAPQATSDIPSPPPNYNQTHGGAPYTSPTQADVRLVTENVRQTFSRADILLETRYVFKNESAKDINLVMRHPIRATVEEEEGVWWGLNAFRMTWDNAPVEAIRQGREYVATVTFKPNATHVARFTYRTTYGTTEFHKFAAYSTGGAASWKGRIERADYSFAYSPATVFGVKEFKPAWNWQWGDNGAYFQRRDFKPTAGEKFVFSFYSP